MSLRLVAFFPLVLADGAVDDLALEALASEDFAVFLAGLLDVDAFFAAFFLAGASEAGGFVVEVFVVEVLAVEVFVVEAFVVEVLAAFFAATFLGVALAEELFAGFVLAAGSAVFFAGLESGLASTGSRAGGAGSALLATFFTGFGLLVVEVALAAERIGFFFPAATFATGAAAASAAASCSAISLSFAFRLATLVLASFFVTSH